MSARRPARKPRKIDAATSRPAVVAIPREPTRDELMQSIEPPAMTLDDIVIHQRHAELGKETLVLTGRELAHVLSLRTRYNNLPHMVENGDVNIRLRGVADLLRTAEDLSREGLYFVACALEDLAARLEADDHGEGLSA